MPTDNLPDDLAEVAELPQTMRILVSWTPSYSGTEAIDFAAWLSRTMPVKVRVLSTLLQPWAATPLFKLGKKYKKYFRKEAEACRAEVEKALSAAGLDESCWDDEVSLLSNGSSKPQLITEAANDFAADMIFLGPNQAAPKGRFMAGSTADTLLHYSPVPVGLAPKQVKLSKHGVTRVNFAFTEEDGQKDDPALGRAAEMAHTWGVPLRIVAFSPSGIIHAPFDNHRDVADELTNQWREQSLALLDVARDWVMERYPELDVRTDIGIGSGWRGAVDALKWKKGDFMVMGSNPMGPIARVFIGSTATELLPHMRVPVLVYPAGN
ncbi:universal stress protein [Corynebacterium sp. 32222D000AT]|nr:universal stress protein [Mycobacteriaceae bacterium]MDY5829282.1 universal stress protein [Corynebacterium sp.]